MKGELKRKSFNELVGLEGPEDDLKFYYHVAKLAKVVDQEKEIFRAEDLPEQPDISDEEVEIRAKVFLRAFKQTEKLHRERINNISFQLNKKALEGCQVKELIQLYNETIGRFLDDFIF